MSYVQLGKEEELMKIRKMILQHPSGVPSPHRLLPTQLANHQNIRFLALETYKKPLRIIQKQVRNLHLCTKMDG